MEYSATKERLDSKVDLMLEKIAEYKKRDLKEPDARSLNDIMMEVAFIGADGRNFETEPYGYACDSKYKTLKEQFSGLMAEEMSKLIDDEIGLNAQELYDYFEKSLKNVATLSSLGDADRKDSLNSICGAYLDTKKRIRDFNREQFLFSNNENIQTSAEDVVYGNKTEYYHVLDGFQNCLKESSLTNFYTTQGDGRVPNIHVDFDTLGNKIYGMVIAITNVYGKTFKELANKQVVMVNTKK